LAGASPTKANPKTFSNLKKTDQKSGNALLAQYKAEHEKNRPVVN
jgi:hypothetical protein